HAQIAAALDEAITESERPRLIICHTHIGNGAPHKHDTHKVHGEPLGKDEAEATKRALGWPLDRPFYIPPEVKAIWARRAEELTQVHGEWRAHERDWLASHPDQAALYRAMTERAVPNDLLQQLAAAAPRKADATRSLGSVVLQKAAELV